MNFVKRHAGKIIVAALCAIIGAFIASIVSKPVHYVDEHKIVETVIIHEEKAYLSFQNDKKTYIAYKNNGVDLNSLAELNYGDEVYVTLEDTRAQSTFTIIFVLKHNNKTLIDVTEYYRNNSYINGTIFVSVPFSISLALIIFMIIENRKPINTIERFENRMWKWLLIFFVATLTFGLIWVIDFAVLSIIKIVPSHKIGLITVGIFFALLGLLGIFVYKRCKFSFKDGVYHFVDLFKKKAIDIKDISNVYCARKPNGMHLYFVGKDDSILYSCVYEPIIIGKDNLLIDSLKNNNIEVEYVDIEFVKNGRRLTYPISEEDQIKAIQLFNKKDYSGAYDLYDSFVKVSNVNFFKFRLMISSLYRDEYDKSRKLYDELTNSSAFVNDKTLLLDIKTIKHTYAIALNENNHNEEANKILDEIGVNH